MGLVQYIAALMLFVLLGWIGLRMLKSDQRAEADPKDRRRKLLVLVGIYSVGAVGGTLNAVFGDAPLWSLCFLPIPLFFVWAYP